MAVAKPFGSPRPPPSSPPEREPPFHRSPSPRRIDPTPRANRLRPPPLSGCPHRSSSYGGGFTCVLRIQASGCGRVCVTLDDLRCLGFMATTVSGRRSPGGAPPPVSLDGPSTSSMSSISISGCCCGGDGAPRRVVGWSLVASPTE